MFLHHPFFFCETFFLINYFWVFLIPYFFFVLFFDFEFFYVGFDWVFDLISLIFEYSAQDLEIRILELTGIDRKKGFFKTVWDNIRPSFLVKTAEIGCVLGVVEYFSSVLPVASGHSLPCCDLLAGNKKRRGFSVEGGFAVSDRLFSLDNGEGFASSSSHFWCHMRRFFTQESPAPIISTWLHCHGFG